MFGAEFESFNPDEPQAVPAVKAVAPSSDAAKDPSKATKGKLNAKSTGLTYQFQIMESIGVPREEIKKFADPLHWLDYFPPIAKEDCNAFGARIDWRRSFLVGTPVTLLPERHAATDSPLLCTLLYRRPTRTPSTTRSSAGR